QNDVAVAWNFGSQIQATGYLSQGETEDYKINVAPVPVPGAVWLLGSGFLGLLGIRRKRN
ncbi:MAG: PEP-CTERM sorting domain-containing protein, partial [Deltaproteobacteria bacterium]|nr:PEP-CTERM sorting domain-containing protein [Deltaproteobacteria bacterium]